MKLKLVTVQLKPDYEPLSQQWKWRTMKTQPMKLLTNVNYDEETGLKNDSGYTTIVFLYQDEMKMTVLKWLVWTKESEIVKMTMRLKWLVVKTMTTTPYSITSPIEVVKLIITSQKPVLIIIIDFLLNYCDIVSQLDSQCWKCEDWKQTLLTGCSNDCVVKLALWYYLLILKKSNEKTDNDRLLDSSNDNIEVSWPVWRRTCGIVLNLILSYWSWLKDEWRNYWNY